ncbi:hemolysin [Saccharobesus litoralis]|uniref:L-ornithine N(alpha)-acyltransferase n=1 Tax=Saccharobesus litoralis TaxID=2172099 RepID=A0A2S0VPH2_9ALTE|nr:GNAT family N-acyltransferase [Saccharobesus litoralis]AWB66115.1 hemolysin [Saccharobesus litoralis]
MSQSLNNPLDFAFRSSWLKWLVERATRLHVVKQWYQDWLENDLPQRSLDNPQIGSEFLDYTLGRLNAGTVVLNEAPCAIKPTGAQLFVANHPLGGLDGMLLTQYLLKLRPDLKVLTNELLLAFPEFKHLFVGVDVLNPNKQRENAKGIRAINQHLKAGGAVLIFPAGTVSELKLSQMKISDAPWHELVAKLQRKHQVDCTPIFVEAKNNIPFYVSGLIHKRLRTVFLLRAMLANKGIRMPIRIGNTITAQEVASLRDGRAHTDFLRLCCESLQSKPHKPKTRQVSSIKGNANREKLIAHHQQLDEYLLVEQGDFAVYCAPHAKMGCVMQQISISRELTFRAVDEGTGKELDSDGFDPYYWHLWVWDKQAHTVVGGYRMAKVDELINQHGVKRLYSNSLYNYDPSFIAKLQNSVEVGRSFIVPEYQKHPRALDMLWKGIGAYMVKNPQYHTIFGCVSISSQYSQMARSLLADTFAYHYATDKAVTKLVKPRKPLKNNYKPWSDALLQSMAEIPIINKLIGRLDAGKTVPVLIRHYLALNGKFISFTVNSSFNNSLDGLITVDLRCAPDKYVKRYLGKQGAEQFKIKWGLQDAA